MLFRPEVPNNLGPAMETLEGMNQLQILWQIRRRSNNQVKLHHAARRPALHT
jgi:hypothetical protein